MSGSTSTYPIGLWHLSLSSLSSHFLRAILEQTLIHHWHLVARNYMGVEELVARSKAFQETRKLVCEGIFRDSRHIIRKLVIYTAQSAGDMLKKSIAYHIVMGPPTVISCRIHASKKLILNLPGQNGTMHVDCRPRATVAFSRSLPTILEALNGWLTTGCTYTAHMAGHVSM
jgi:hypothetical protein